MVIYNTVSNFSINIIYHIHILCVAIIVLSQKGARLMQARPLNATTNNNHKIHNGPYPAFGLPNHSLHSSTIYKHPPFSPSSPIL